MPYLTTGCSCQPILLLKMAKVQLIRMHGLWGVSVVGGPARVLGVVLLSIRLSSAPAVSGVGDSVGMLKALGF